ncbi:MAG: PIN domain-containing protein [bacterium]
MQLPDVNVLIYAHREDAPEHNRYAAWLRTLTEAVIEPSRRHWDIFVGLCTSIQGPLVTDAYLAALAIEHGCELVTTDSDFARFRGLRWRHRLAM